MVKQKDPVWEEWINLGKAADGKCYAKCKHCDHKLLVNACRFKKHIVLQCMHAPETVKNKYRGTVSQQSLVTPKQKVTLDQQAHQHDSASGPHEKLFMKSK